MIVGNHLHLDVAGMLDVLLEIDFAVAEGGLGLGLGLLEGGLQRQIVQCHAHPPSPAARRRLDQHRKAKLVGQANGMGFILDQALAARHGGNAHFLGQFAGGVLVAHQGHGLVRGTDEFDLATAANLGKMRILRQETVTRMNRLHVADLGGANHAVDLQVAINGFRRTDAIGLGGQIEIGRAAIGLAEDGHRLDAHLAASAKDPQGDFTAIGNQDSLEHQKRGQSPCKGIVSVGIGTRLEGDSPLF